MPYMITIVLSASIWFAALAGCGGGGHGPARSANVTFRFNRIDGVRGNNLISGLDNSTITNNVVTNTNNFIYSYGAGGPLDPRRVGSRRRDLTLRRGRRSDLRQLEILLGRDNRDGRLWEHRPGLETRAELAPISQVPDHFEQVTVMARSLSLQSSIAPVQLLELSLAAFHAASALSGAQSQLLHPAGRFAHIPDTSMFPCFETRQYSFPRVHFPCWE